MKCVLANSFVDVHSKCVGTDFGDLTDRETLTPFVDRLDRHRSSRSPAAKELMRVQLIQIDRLADRAKGHLVGDEPNGGYRISD